MKFHEAESRYKKLRTLLGKQKITNEQYQDEVAKLRLQMPDGTWWQVDPGDGSWRKWDGSSWVLAVKPSTAASPAFAPPPGASIKPAKPKKKPAPLGWRIFTFLFLRGFLMLLSFLTAWVLHTYLLVWKNDGYNAGSAIAAWLNVTGSSDSASAIWLSASGFFWSFIIGSFRAGPAKTIGLLVSAPFRLFTNVAKSGIMGLGSAAAGTGLSMAMLSRFGFNNEALLTISISWFFVAMGSAGLIAAKSIAKNFRKSGFYSVAGIYALQLFFASIAFGFLICTVMSGGAVNVLGTMLLVAGIAVWVVGSKNRLRAPQVALFLLFGTVSAGVILLLEALFARPVFADDGGWTEFIANNPNGTFEDWLQDSASQTAIEHGLTPATASGLGALAPGMGSDVDLDDVEPDDFLSQLSDADRQRIQRLTQDFTRMLDSGNLPEPLIMRAGIDITPPTWEQIYDRLRGVNEYIQKLEIPREWPDTHGLWESQVTARSVLIAIIAGVGAAAAGLTAPWIAGFALAAGLADKYGPDATEILDMAISNGDGEPEPEPEPPRESEYNIHTDFQRLMGMPRDDRIKIWSDSRSYWRQATEGAPATNEGWSALKQQVHDRMTYELEPRIYNGTASWSEEREYRNLYNEWHVLRTLVE